VKFLSPVKVAKPFPVVSKKKPKKECVVLVNFYCETGEF
jgi:hypothetical protein